jgi:thioredoxin 1
MYSVSYVTDQSFEAEVLKSDKPVLVDFTASWCGPCKVLAPIVDKIASESEGKYKVVKVDIDEAPTLAARYGIRGVPTVVAFDKGEIKGQHVGVTNKETLLKLL